jgi:hypothetical protein
MFANNYTSTIVETQLPDFVRADHPKFVALLKKYYEYLESSNKVLDVNKKLYDYIDVDTTRVDLLKYFKEKIIPNFPEETALSKEKIIKAARDFYAKKGTADSFKFLFSVLYNQDIDIYFPKEDIIKASDGKWKLPQALRLIFSDKLTLVTGGNVNVFAVTANTVNANGFNLVSAGITANSYIQIGNEKRKVVTINAAGDYLRVEIPFANTANAQTYNTQKLYRVTLSEYANFDVTLLERRQGVGETSRTTCIIEKAIQTVDKTTGREIVELYVSNVTRLFDEGENLIVQYEDNNGNPQTFKSKIASLISNLTLFRNRSGIVQTGRKYKTNDPVVFFGGLADTPDAQKAIAVVNNVSTGAIQSLTVNSGGFLFRATPNSQVRIFSNTGIGANVVVSRIWEDAPNSNTIQFNTDSIVYKRDITLNNENGYDFDNASARVGLITNPGNTTTAVNLNTATFTAASSNNYYNSLVLKITAGTGAANSPNTATIASYNGVSKIATLSTALAVSPDATSNVLLIANAQTKIGTAFSYDALLLGSIRQLTLLNGGSFFEEPPTFDVESFHDSDYAVDEGLMLIPAGQFSNYNKTGTPPSIRLSSSNSSYSLANGFYTGTRLFLDVGTTSHYSKVVDYVVTNANSSANVKTLYLDRAFANNITSTNILNFQLILDYRPNVRGTGKIGKIIINRGGTGYSSTDSVNFVGTGCNANATITVDANGSISGFNLDNRGEGYYEMPTIRILNANGSTVSSGSNAEFILYGLSDGENITAETDDIGRIQDFRIISRGLDYEQTPVVSLKIVDILTDNLPAGTIVVSGETVWQGGATNTDATFTGVIDDVYRPNSQNSVIRVFGYSGLLNTSLPVNLATSSGNLTVNLFTANATVSFNDVNDAVERQYPHYYGNGLAKANAEFLRGLIKYSGFYLNTDGFPSSDKRLQNDDYYHNFSYEIGSEKSLFNYKETINKIIHPVGMQLLSKFLIKNDLDESVVLTSNIHIANTLIGSNLNTSYTSNVVYGNNANFTSTVNVGDLIVINSTETATLKQYTRVVANVVNANVIWLESPVGGPGDGRLRIIANSSGGNANVTLFANSYVGGESLEAGDNISFNISGTIYDRYLVSDMSNTLVVLNNSVGFTNANVMYMRNPTLNVVEYKIISTNG